MKNEEVCPEPNENELMSLVQAYIQADTHRSAEFAKFVSKKGRDIPAPELDEYNALGLRIFEDIKWKTDWPVGILRPLDLLHLTQLGQGPFEEDPSHHPLSDL